jgi:cullin-4
MTSVFLLLSFPRSSKGLSELRHTVVDDVDGHPHKIARLTTDSDSASASRPKTAPVKLGKPVQIQIIGDHGSTLPPGEKQLALLRRCFRSILTRLPGPDDTIPATYEGIYNTCRSVIMVSHLGDKLYDILRIELLQSIARLSKILSESTEKETKWITTFNKALKWFDDQIVSFESQSRANAKSQIVPEPTTVFVDLSRPSLLERCYTHSVRFSALKTPFSEPIL